MLTPDTTLRSDPSPLTGRSEVLFGTITRHGIRLLIGDAVLHDDATGPNRHARILAHEPGTT